VFAAYTKRGVALTDDSWGGGDEVVFAKANIDDDVKAHAPWSGLHQPHIGP